MGGSTALHTWSFRLRTWVGFLLAGVCAGALVSGMVFLFGHGVAGAASNAGVVSKKDAAILEDWAMLVLELFTFARLYDAVANSRDEAMYQGIVAKAHEHAARKLV